MNTEKDRLCSLFMIKNILVYVNTFHLAYVTFFHGRCSKI